MTQDYLAESIRKMQEASVKFSELGWNKINQQINMANKIVNNTPDLGLTISPMAKAIENNNILFKDNFNLGLNTSPMVKSIIQINSMTQQFKDLYSNNIWQSGIVDSFVDRMSIIDEGLFKINKSISDMYKSINIGSKLSTVGFELNNAFQEISKLGYQLNNFNSNSDLMNAAAYNLGNMVKHTLKLNSGISTLQHSLNSINKFNPQEANLNYSTMIDSINKFSNLKFNFSKSLASINFENLLSSESLKKEGISDLEASLTVRTVENSNELTTEEIKEAIESYAKENLIPKLNIIGDKIDEKEIGEEKTAKEFLALIADILTILAFIWSLNSNPISNTDYSYTESLDSNKNIIIKDIKSEYIEELNKMNPEDDINNYRYIDADCLNVRNDTNEQSEIIGHLYLGSKVRMLRKKENWALVEWVSEDKQLKITGWVSTKYIKKFN
jgi:hypothetical protein